MKTSTGADRLANFGQSIMLGTRLLMFLFAVAIAAVSCVSAGDKGSRADRRTPADAAGPTGSRLTLGPMVGHTTHESVHFWVQAAGSGRLTAVVTEANGDENRGTVTLEASGFGVVEVGDLDPSTEYRARFLLDDSPIETDGPIAFQTFPQPGEPVSLRIAVVSCARVSWDSVQTVWTAIAADRPDVVLWLGDNNYFEQGDSTHLSDWEDPARMAFKYGELRALPTLQPLLRQAIHYAIWDDHDYANGEADRTFPLKNEVNQTFERFWANAYYGGPGLDGVYSNVVMGDVELFLTDDRFYRDPEDDPQVPGKTILGERQLAWLKQRLAESTAPLKIIAVGVQVLADYHKYDGYLNYPHERAEILDWIRKQRIEGVVFVSGDRHLSELMRDTNRIGYPLYEMTASPVGNRPFQTGLDQPNPIRIGGYSQGLNYGLLDIDTVSDPATITFRLKDAEGREVLSHRVQVDELRH